MSEKEEWLLCSNPLVGDVIRWNEPLWAQPTKPRGKPDKIGEQRITANLIAAGDFLELEVLGVEKLSSGDALLRVKIGDRIKRKSSTIAMGACSKCTG